LKSPPKRYSARQQTATLHSGQYDAYSQFAVLSQLVCANCGRPSAANLTIARVDAAHDLDGDRRERDLLFSRSLATRSDNAQGFDPTAGSGLRGTGSGGRFVSKWLPVAGCRFDAFTKL